MDNSKNGGYATSAEQRKQLLITQGAMYRSGIVASRETVKNGLRAESLASSAIKQLGLAALSSWGGPASLLSSLPKLAPLVLGGISSLWRQPGWKSLARGAVVAGVVASAATIFFKRKKRRAEAEMDTESGAVSEPEVTAD